MKFDFNLNTAQYLEVVEAIANGFFDENGEYVPHVGRVISMGVFCDYCMKESIFQDVQNPDLDVVFSNEDIIGAYNAALHGDTIDRLNFHSAYQDAMAIVDQRKNSLSRLVNSVATMVEQVVTPENITKLFGETNRFYEVIKEDPNKVVSLFEETAKV